MFLYSTMTMMVTSEKVKPMSVNSICLMGKIAPPTWIPPSSGVVLRTEAMFRPAELVKTA